MSVADYYRSLAPVQRRSLISVIATPSPRPVFLHEGKQPAFYLRTGGGTRPLDIQEATEHISRRWARR